jgi:outer membrane murein-binding lipoprotein Lpp
VWRDQDKGKRLKALGKILFLGLLRENAMTWIINACKHLTLVVVLFSFLAVAGCEGTDTREKVDDTVKELSGKKDLDRMEQMKKTINKAQQQDQERFKKTEESAQGKY